MKNVTKILFLSVLTCLLLAFGCSDVNAASKTKTITIKSSKKITNMITNYDEDFVIYKTTSKKTVYGLEFDKKSLKKKTKLTFDKNADAGLLYILENGYPKSKITGDTATDKYITETAIWLYMDESGKGSHVNSILKDENNEKDSYKLVSNYIKPLVESAIKANKEGYKTKEASMKINSGKNNLYLSKNKKYYESDYIFVNLEGATKYTVSSEATILDENGNKKKKFNASEAFKVRIPVSKISDNNKITVTVKATGKENIAKIYVPNDKQYQSVVGLFSKKHALKESFDLSVTVSKNCKYMDGNYHDKTGNVTDEKTYKKECSNVCKIVNENYYDSTGEETSKLIFDKECSNSCVINGDVYYGVDGRQVDKNTFDKECPVVNAAKVVTTKDSSEKEKTAKAKAEKEKTAKVKAEKEKAAKVKAEKEKAAKAKAEKEKAAKEKIKNNEKQDSEQSSVNPEGTLEVEVPNTNADVSLSNILFGTILVLMGIGVIYRKNKIIN